VLGTSTRISDIYIYIWNDRISDRASRMVRGGRGPPVRGALYERTSIAARCTALLQPRRVGSMGQPPNFGTRVPGNLSRWMQTENRLGLGQYVWRLG
jgi:hypothetical protein